jgi:nickel-type superoxide dismutase maturation protease
MPRTNARLRRLRHTSLFLAGTLVAIATLRLTRAYAVEGDSMRPTLEHGDYVHGLRLPPWGRPRIGVGVGAIVVARRPDQPDLAVIKRVADVTTEGRSVLRGDNPAASTDSRQFGTVDAESLEALVWLRYWPPRRARLLVGRFRPPPDAGWLGHAS